MEVIDEGWVRDPEGLLKYQEQVFEKLVQVRSSEVVGLGEFGHRYPSYGSDHAICEFLTSLAVAGQRQIYVLAGDYEGYAERAITRGIDVKFVEEDEDPAGLPNGFWFVSNPSARDGNFLPGGTVERILDAGHNVIYDLAYLGMTQPRQLDLRHKNIRGALISFSKPYGLFAHRIGFSFFRDVVPALEANRLWFKNIFGLTLARQVLELLNQARYVERYKAEQAAIVQELVADSALPLRASDAFLLAHVTKDDALQLTGRQREMLSPYSRADGHRLCLTPYFFERAGQL